MYKELIARLRVGVASGRVVFSSFASLGDEAADSIEALQSENERMQTELQNSITRRKEQMAAADFDVASLKAERDTLRQQLAEAQCDAERYRYIRAIGGISWTASEDQERVTNGTYDALVDVAMKGAAAPKGRCG
jgi:multidrug resistance efflux pump